MALRSLINKWNNIPTPGKMYIYIFGIAGITLLDDIGKRQTNETKRLYNQAVSISSGIDKSLSDTEQRCFLRDNGLETTVAINGLKEDFGRNCVDLYDGDGKLSNTVYMGTISNESLKNYIERKSK